MGGGGGGGGGGGAENICARRAEAEICFVERRIRSSGFIVYLLRPIKIARIYTE